MSLGPAARAAQDRAADETFRLCVAGRECFNPSSSCKETAAFLIVYDNLLLEAESFSRSQIEFSLRLLYAVQQIGWSIDEAARAIYGSESAA